MLKLLLRDLTILAATLLLWQVNAQLKGNHDAVAVVVAIGAGISTVVVGFLAHEWGHLLGALSRRSMVTLPSGLTSVFLFQFDLQNNSREQYLAMSMGGFAASAAVVALMLWVFAFDGLAERIALMLTSLGVLATIAIEVPDAMRVYRRKPGSGLQAVSPDHN